MNWTGTEVLCTCPGEAMSEHSTKADTARHTVPIMKCAEYLQKFYKMCCVDPVFIFLTLDVLDASQVDSAVDGLPKGGGERAFHSGQG